MSTSETVVARWRRRRSTPFTRIVWILVFLTGFVAAAVFFRDWAANNRPKDVENFRPAYVVVLAALYWAVPIALWGVLYPADGRRLFRTEASAPPPG